MKSGKDEGWHQLAPVGKTPAAGDRVGRGVDCEQEDGGRLKTVKLQVSNVKRCLKCRMAKRPRVCEVG